MELIKKLIELRRLAQEQLDKLVEAPGKEGRNLNDTEKLEFDKLVVDIRAYDDRIEELRETERRAAAAAVVAGQIEGLDIGEGRVHIRHEPMTYDRNGGKAAANGGQGSSFFGDVFASQMRGDTDARQRLMTHRREVEKELAGREARATQTFDRGLEGVTRELRDITRTDGAGGEFVPPLWLVEEYAAKERAGRTFANLVNNRPLPPGTDSINVPRITTGTATAIQTADNSGVQETDIITATLTVPVQTIAGQQDVSIQLLEQSPIAFDEVIFSDLIAAYNANVDAQCLNGSAGSGQVRGLRNVTGVNTSTYTDATPTVPEMYPKLADAINKVATNRFRAPELLLMHPRRWYWELAALDSSSRPLVVPIAQGPYMAEGVGMQVVAEGAVGSQLGVAVYIDPNVITTAGAGTEDEIYATRPSDHWLWESSIRTRVLPDVGSGTLTVRLQVYAYLAFTAGRYPTATTILSGTGLIAPTF